MRKVRTYATQCIKCEKTFQRERNASLVCEECRAKVVTPKKAH